MLTHVKWIPWLPAETGLPIFVIIFEFHIFENTVQYIYIAVMETGLLSVATHE